MSITMARCMGRGKYWMNYKHYVFLLMLTIFCGENYLWFNLNKIIQRLQLHVGYKKNF